MKYYLGFLLALTISLQTLASNFATPGVLRAEDIMLFLYKSDQKISLAQYLKLTPSEYRSITGKKLNLKEKISLKIFQRHLKKSVNKDGTVNMDKLATMEKELKKFNFGWFIFGFFFGLIALIVVLFIKDEKRKDRIRWTASGWLTAILFVLILAMATSGTT